MIYDMLQKLLILVELLIKKKDTVMREMIKTGEHFTLTVQYIYYSFTSFSVIVAISLSNMITISLFVLLNDLT